MSDEVPQSPIRHAKRIAILVIGVTVVLVGILGIVLPLVPAVVLIPAGLAILASEFIWARKWLQRARAMATRKGDRTVRKGDRTVEDRRP